MRMLISGSAGNQRDYFCETRATMPALVMGISSDILYAEYQQRMIAELLPQSTYTQIDSPHGHDAFLINLDQVSRPLQRFLER